MADFRTHLNGGILVSGGSVLALHGLGLASDRQTLALFALGVAGSLLPDIDADASAPLRASFGVLGVCLAFVLTLPLAGELPLWGLAAAWCTVLFSVRVALYELFTRFTVHRGIWHSWLAIAFAALATVNIGAWLVQAPASTAWTAGLMVGIGYLTHLCLDEMYSVDLLNTRVKRSFGTALKPFSLADPGASLAMAAAVGVLLWLAPRGVAFAELAGALGVPQAPIAALLALGGVWADSLRTIFN